MFLDIVAGRYPVSADVQAVVDGSLARYTIAYEPRGTSVTNKMLIWALPHQTASLTVRSAANTIPLLAETATMGNATGCLANELEMEEILPVSIGFMPWSRLAQQSGSILDNDAVFNARKVYRSAKIRALLSELASSEIEAAPSEDPSRGPSMYFAGKVLDKLAMATFTAMYLSQDLDTAALGLARLKQLFDVYFTNAQRYPLGYDSTWGGLITSLADGDFGAAQYNDHHFHYGYFVHAAALVGVMDAALGGAWAQNSTHRAWVDHLIRDVANPSDRDMWYPKWRHFDWYVGH